MLNVLLTAALIGGLVWCISSIVAPVHNSYAASKGPLLSQDQTKVLQQMNQEQTAIGKAVTPAVVSITGTKVIRQREGDMPSLDDPFFRQFFGRGFSLPREWKERFLGSGAIVSEDGYIITNNHVVDKAKDKEVTVILGDRREFKGKIVGTDSKSDLAVVKIDAKGLASLPWSDSNNLQVGEIVFAVGSPFGYSQTLTKGMVSFIGRTGVIDGGRGYENFIQTDAAINPGNSGGPLVNIRGEIVGINTAIASTTGGFNGVGFAIPSNLAHTVLESIVKHGKVVRPWLGVQIQPLNEDLAKSFGLEGVKGALVNEASQGSPAEKAGIHKGDVIVQFGGEEVLDPGQLKYLVGQSPADAKVKVGIVRDGKKKDIEVKLEEQPRNLEAHFSGYRKSEGEDEEEGAAGEAEYNNVLDGITVQDLTRSLAERYEIPSEMQGVLVTGVDSDSLASDKGIRKGDVIQEVKRQAVKSVADYRKIAAKIKKDETVLLSVNRQGMSVFMALTPSSEGGKKKEPSD